jgi:hypothetical protein
MSNTRKMADYAADVPTTIGSSGQVLKVNSGGTAYEWAAIGDTLPAGASAGQVLKRNSGNTDYEWGDAESAINVDGSGNPTLGTGITASELRTLLSAQQSAVGLVPPDWASPSNTYTSSGTWSKGSLADTDIVWVYGVGGGNGGMGSAGSGMKAGGKGGQAFFVVATAGQLDGVSYVVGAGGANWQSNGGQTTITVSGVTYTSGVAQRRDQGLGLASSGFNQLTGDDGSAEVTNTYDITYNYPSKFSAGYSSQFNAGDGANIYSDGSGNQATTSSYAGDGGLHPGNPSLGAGEGTYIAGNVGVAPGGGGGASYGSSGGAGANGIIKFYHV